MSSKTNWFLLHTCRAKATLASLGARVRTISPSVAGESDYQKHKRLQKAMTGPLDKLLYRCRQRKEFAQIEAIAFVWEDVFPQLASNVKHRTIICENYAQGLNHQQRFNEVVDKLFRKQLSFSEDGAVSVNSKTLILSPHLAESILVACGHLKDSTSALQLLDIMRASHIRITKIAYFHLLNTLLKDEECLELDTVLQLCEEVVHDLNDTVPLSLLPTVIKVAAEHDELDRAMNVYSHPADAPMCSFTEFRFEICLQTLCDQGYVSAMMEVYKNVMTSTTATRGLKERISKCLLLKCLKDRKVEHRDAVIEVALELMATMDEHEIATSHHCVYPLIRTLLQANMITNIDDLLVFFAKYEHVLEWNSFSICEAVIACVYCKEVQMVDELFVHALDNNIPIKYAALEKVVSFYYKLGMLGDLEKVADIIRALRLNKHIPLGIAVTEIGMASNIRLGRFQEVIHLFEDFSAMDGDRKRILKRRIMLKSALKAYAALNRLDESNAIRTLLGNSYGNVLKRVSDSTSEGDEDEDDEDFGDFFTESIDKIES